MNSEKASVKNAAGFAQIKMIPTENLRANPYSRIAFTGVDVEQLSKSIVSQGVQEPLVVRPTEEHEVYEIVSGHRRWKAVELAHLPEVPCLVRNLTHQQVCEMNIVSNIQRDHTPALELARMMSDYLFRFPQPQADAAKRFGKSVQWLADVLGLLHMPPEILKSLDGVHISLRTWKLFNRLTFEHKLELSNLIRSGVLLASDLDERIKERLKNTRVRTDRRKAPRRANDPLAGRWDRLLASDQVAPPGSWNVRYAGNNRWELTYPVDLTQPGPSLAGFLRRLAEALESLPS